MRVSGVPAVRNGSGALVLPARCVRRLVQVTSREVEKAIVGYSQDRLWCPLRLVIIPNCALLGWEADLLLLRRRWLEEIEIKVSVADFRREFRTKASKHKKLTTPHALPIRRYWFAVPWTIAEVVRAELPPYAGLIVVGPEQRGKWYSARIVVKAKNLQCADISAEQRERAYKSIYHRYWGLRGA